MRGIEKSKHQSRRHVRFVFGFRVELKEEKNRYLLTRTAVSVRGQTGDRHTAAIYNGYSVSSGFFFFP